MLVSVKALKTCEFDVILDFGKMSADDTLYFLIAENRVFRSNVQSVSKYAIFDFVILLIVWQITLFLNFLSPKTGCSARGIKYVFLTKQAAFFYRTHTVRLLHLYGSPTVSARNNQQCLLRSLKKHVS